MKFIGNFDGSLADITSVVAGTGLSGGGTTGAVTLNVDASIPEITTLAGLTAVGAASATLTSTSYGVFDINRSAANGEAGAESITALHIDFDRIVPTSGTYNFIDVGINLDVTSAGLGSTRTYGMDIDVVGATSGASTAYGIDLNVSGADYNNGIQVLCEGEQLRLSHNASDYATFTVADTGDLTIETVGDGTTDSDLILDADGRIDFQPADGRAVNVTSTEASAGGTGGSLNLVSNDGAALGDDHRLGKLGFQAAEDGAGTLRQSASIEAYADAAWSSTVNDTRLEFYTMDGDNNKELSLTLDSDLLATFAGAVTVTGALTGTLATATQPNITSIGTDGDNLRILADQLTMLNTSTDAPVIKLSNTTDDDQAGQLIFEKLRDDDAVAQGQNLGEIWFRGQDAAQQSEDYAYIIGEIDVSTDGEESGQLKLGVANHDGGNGAGLTLTGGSEDNEIDVTLGLGAASVTTVAGDLTVTGSDLTFDSVALTAVQTSGESFVDNDTSIMTSAAIDDKINTKYARSVISFQGQATMLSSGNWITTGQNGISNHTWNRDMGVNTETNGTSTASLAKQYGHQGVRMPYACTIENIYCAIRNAGGDRQTTVGLFCARAADDTGGSGLPVAWGTTTATAPILQIHADANNESGSHQNRPAHAEASVDVAMAAGDIFYPAIKLTGVTSSGDTDQILASFTVGIKTLIV